MATFNMPVGGSSALAGATGVVASSVTPTGTPATTVETDLFTYTLPANALSGAADIVRIFIGGAFAGNDNVKTIRLKVQTGAGPAFTTAFTLTDTDVAPGHLNGHGFGLHVQLYGTPTAASVFTTLSMSAGGVVAAPLTATALSELVIDGTLPIIIKLTGENGTAAASDIITVISTVEYLSSAT